MPKKQVHDSTQEFERARVRSQKQPYVLRLYVTGTTPQSARAIANQGKGKDKIRTGETILGCCVQKMQRERESYQADLCEVQGEGKDKTGATAHLYHSPRGRNGDTS